MRLDAWKMSTHIDTILHSHEWQPQNKHTKISKYPVVKIQI